jgi:excisionase family DNA binding protein
MRRTRHTALSTIWSAPDEVEVAETERTPLFVGGVRFHEREGEPQPLLVTVQEAAKMLRIGRTVVYELMHKRAIRSIKIGRTRRVVRASLAEYVSHLLDEAS